MNRGERTANKTRKAIKHALLELIKEKNYPDITINEITERGDIGRSTLYKHYKSKADILVNIHRDTFENLFSSFNDKESWFALEPPYELITFFKISQRSGRNPFLLSYKLGSDLDYLITNINNQLTETIELKLKNSFNDDKSTIPLPVLAQSISNLYSGLMISWFTKFKSTDINEFAAYIHKMTRALILEATIKK